MYEGLTSADHEDWEPEYDAGDLEEEEEDGEPIIGPITGFELFLITKYSGNVDKDTGYGANSHFTRAITKE